ncbi:response regulator transcription factor [Gracilibacillus sp. S3-1-1]|uniref:Response regulator transcription factor n=1 Tax=Gracilibacillus pellucidus TaxID=3095368 RepID=A0ACC6M3X9_9BACI|nr:response regulator transcription factor [Gracilibacillus sp. S3-1-1]MDX8045673.1 response regulator transcription factor [Gracilibacillus sp. S3-1-1]
MKTLLIVDDEQQMRMMLSLYLRNDFHLLEAKNGTEAVQLFKQHDIDLVLLDIMMPDVDGLDTCKRMKQINPDIPVILLTALNETSQKVRGLTIGADDYIVKPFEPEELIARIHVQMRHFKKEKDQQRVIEMKELYINPISHTAFVNNQEVKYSPKEFDLLYLMASHPNRVYTREQLLDLVWGMEDIVDIRTVDSHVRYVRDKLKKAGMSYQPLETVWGVGYKFNQGDQNETQ